ncbi:hypothetical protein LE13_01655 [Salmonella enterica subsp. enterica]|uniref:Uncharacterized protein n=1 Tax=Salmonella enterica subsp. enterica serovar Javiana TaxID=363569 RepID=A0A736LVR7_SALET|nr:hypothetical protein [Salmonella enterica]EAW1142038.1 hypothetical protein [Salmonella enterica subsp. enterica]ECU8554654.1 hypothetical protein [Salmonella enterica subsp. enterica serovar Javiana]EAU9436385.1 hypothetical protein [Salmonella enterica]EAV3098888.1 hypothetical protein [Salmonella enterica]
MINDIKNDLPQNRLVYKHRHICSQPFMRVISRLANVYFIEITILERLTSRSETMFHKLETHIISFNFQTVATAPHQKSLHLKKSHR